MVRIILKEAYYLFGDGKAVSKKGKTRAAILYLEMLSNSARAERDYKTAKDSEEVGGEPGTKQKRHL